MTMESGAVGQARIDLPLDRLALFVSALRDDCRPARDVDILVELEPGATPGLAFFGMEIGLSELLGRRFGLA